MMDKKDFIIKFRRNRRAYYSLLIFAFLFATSLFAEFIANDKPIIIYFDHKIYLPIFQEIPETEFGGELYTEADYQDPAVQNLVKQKGWILFPPIQYSYDTINMQLNARAPSAPSCHNLLGTDDQGRDVVARIIYGVRISLIFGLILSSLSLMIGIVLGSVQGYFGGKIDLLFQRFIEIWSSLPVMYLLIILSSIITPSFFTLLILMLLFSWVGVVSYVRAEFLRLRNFDYVRASRSLGASHSHIIFRQILPNASPIIIANLPFLLASSITTLTALDFIGLGLAVGSPSLGELLAQGKNNLSSYWLGISGFFITTLILTILVFIAEGLRDGFDNRK